jgi:hypothetical protein
MALPRPTRISRTLVAGTAASSLMGDIGLVGNNIGLDDGVREGHTRG